MLGIVFEGGGAKGSFQVGLLRALLEHGYEFDGAVGSSIGALNAAMFVQGDFERCYEIWERMEFSKIFDFQDIYAENLAKNNFDRTTLKYFFIKLREAIKNRGLDTTKIKMLIDYYIDEERLRASKKDFGLMTVRTFEDGAIFSPRPMYKEDIPYGCIADYIVASANFPGFPAHYIDNKPYRDGGLYDNLPINMLIDKGYTDIIAVPLRGYFSFKQKPKSDNVNIQYIVPSEKPGRMLDFNNAPVNRGMEMGYYDGLRFIHHYIGTFYYIEDIVEYEILGNIITSFPMQFVRDMCSALEIEYMENNRMFNMFNIVARLRKLLDIKEMLSTAEVFMALVEKYATDVGVERLKLYKMKELVRVTLARFMNRDGDDKRGVNNRKKMQLDSAFLTFSKYFK